MPDSLPPSAVPASIPPSRAPSRRPVYLVIALLLVWIVGLFGAAEGCQTVDILHRPEAVRMESNHINDVEIAKRVESHIDTILALRRMVTPLAIAQLLLGSVLTLSAGLTLLGRAQLRSLAIQAMLAYSLFLPIDYLIRRPMRAFEINSIAEGLAYAPGGGPTLDAIDQRAIFWWAYRGALALKLIILSCGILALTRPRVRAFFDSLAAERAREQEP